MQFIHSCFYGVFVCCLFCFLVVVATIKYIISFELLLLLLSEVTEDRLRKFHIQTAIKKKKYTHEYNHNFEEPWDVIKRPNPRTHCVEERAEMKN